MTEDLRSRLLEIWRQLADGERRALLSYAAFLLHQQEKVGPAPVTEPLAIPAPAGENAFQALKRLRKSYPMIEANGGLLDDASQLMTQRVFGASDQEIIPQLAALFEQRYQAWQAARQSKS